MTEIYLNGTIISSVYGEEGDELRPALKPLNEFLHLKIKDVYNMLDHYANEIDLYSPYSISGLNSLNLLCYMITLINFIQRNMTCLNF